MSKRYLVSYEMKCKGRSNTCHNATEYADSKKEIREYYKLLGYKNIKVEEIEED